MILEIPATFFVLFFRREFGERYFPPQRLLLALGYLLIWIWVSRDETVFGPFQEWGVGIGDGEVSPLLQILAMVVAAFGLYHLIQIGNRNREGRLWHPDSTGLSYLDLGGGRFLGDHLLPAPYQLHDWTVYRVVEPVAALLIAWLASVIAPELGLFLGISAVSFTIHNAMIYSSSQAVYFGAAKEVIEKRWLLATDELLDKRLTDGYAPTALSPRMRATLKRRLDELEAYERGQLPAAEVEIATIKEIVVLPNGKE